MHNECEGNFYLLIFFFVSFHCSAYYEGLQDKLGQLKDAREALNALREEHAENKRRQAMERERLRQIQLATKLDDMRQKKQVEIARLAESIAEQSVCFRLI